MSEATMEAYLEDLEKLDDVVAAAADVLTKEMKEIDQAGMEQIVASSVAALDEVDRFLETYPVMVFLDMKLSDFLMGVTGRLYVLRSLAELYLDGKYKIV